MNTTIKDVSAELMAHERECEMFRVGVNSRLRKIERIFYGVIVFILLDYLTVLDFIKETIAR